MTKMTKTITASIALLLAVTTASIAATAANQTAASDIPAPVESSATAGDATLEEVNLNGPPSGGRISEEDPDMDEEYVDPNTPIIPTAELAGSIDGTTFSGTIHIDATASNVTFENYEVLFEGTVLLTDGNSRQVKIAPLQARNFELIGETLDIAVSYDLSEFITSWSSPGTTINGVEIESMSTSIKVSLHPAYKHPEFDITGYKASTAPLMLTFTR